MRTLQQRAARGGGGGGQPAAVEGCAHLLCDCETGAVAPAAPGVNGTLATVGLCSGDNTGPRLGEESARAQGSRDRRARSATHLGTAVLAALEGADTHALPEKALFAGWTRR